MAYDDIQVFSTPGGGGPRIVHYGMDASETFGKGDVVVLAATGQIQEALGTGPLAEGLTGIAMGGPSGPGGITLTNPRTDTTYAENDRIPVAIPDMTSYFITKNFTTDESSFSDVAPTTANIGDACALVDLSAGTWGIDSGPDSGTETCRIHDVLNARKESIVDTGETLAITDTFWIVFQIVSHQGTSANVTLGQASAPISET